MLQLDPATIRIWAVVDCTDMRTTRVGSGSMTDGSRSPIAFEMQREFYSRTFVPMRLNICQCTYLMDTMEQCLVAAYLIMIMRY
jgi:hypothetical protein